MIDGLNSWSHACAGAVWRGCWQGTLLLAAVWAVCLLLPRLPAGVRYWLWWLGCAKVLAGLMLASTINVAILPASASRTAHTLSWHIDTPRRIAGSLLFPRHPAPTANVVVPVPAAPAQSAATNTTPALAVTPTQTVVIDRPIAHTPSRASILCIVWILGVLLQVMLALRNAVRLRKVIRRAVPVHDAGILADVERLATQLRMPAPRLLRSDTASGLCVAGLWRPVILVPASWDAPGEGELSCEERRMAIAPELAHLRRRDLWLDLVLTVTGCLFFFWPPVRLAVRRCFAAREEACDAAALRVTACSGAAYSAMLIKAATPQRVELTGALAFSPAYRQLKSRMTALSQSTRELSLPMRIVVTIAVSIVLVALFPWRLTARAVHVVSAAVADAQRYAIADLGPISGEDATFFKLNERGQVVGTSESRPIFWDGARLTSLPTLRYHYGRGGGVNDNGQYAVTCYSGYGNPHAYYWQNGSHAIKGLPGYRFSVARGMNNAGWIAGSVQHSGQDSRGAEIAHAVVIVDGHIRDLGTLGGLHSAAYSVNDAGQIVGKADISPSGTGRRTRSTHAFLWQNGVMNDLGTLGGNYSLAYAVNNRGQAVGFSETPDGGPGNGAPVVRDATSSGGAAVDAVRHACLWQDGHPVDLGALGADTVSEAHGVNDNGQIVGTSDTNPEAAANRATLWQGGRALDLNSTLVNAPEWRLVDAMAINNHGQIVGKGLRDGVQHAFLLTPVVKNEKH